jgi:hypothetical protein
VTSEPRARLIVGPAADARRAAAAAWLDALPPDAEALVIASSREAADDLVREAAARAGARFGIARATLRGLALRLAAPALADARRTPAGVLALTAVAARAVHGVSQSSTLAHFAPVAGRPGFPPALARTFDELRLHGVAARALGALPRIGADMVALMTAVERELEDAGLADGAFVLDAAVTAARADPPPHPVGLPLLLLDVAVDDPAEEALVAALAHEAPSGIFASAPTGDERGIARLARALGTEPEALADVVPASLGTLHAHLFEPAVPARRPLDDSVAVAAWPGEARECVEIARAVQEEAAAGTPFDRIAVLLHSPAEYVGHVEEAFVRADIPVFLARGSRRPHPGGRALLALLGCVAEGLSARRFAEYLSLAQVPDPPIADPTIPDPTAPPAPDGGWAPPESELLPDGEEPLEEPERDATLDDPAAAAIVAGTLRAPWRWERLLVEAAVIGGAGRWEKRLNGLDRQLELTMQSLDPDEDQRWLERLARTRRDLDHLRGFALPLVERLSTAPRAATWGEWLAWLERLVVIALREPEPVLAALGELAPMAPVGPVGLEEVRLVLLERLRDLSQRPARRRYGAVFVASPAAVRGLSFDVVFVPGLAEGLFPAKIVEDPLLLDEQRRVLAGADLDLQAHRAARERLALKLAVGAARRRIVLSYPRVDVERARPRVPSFYALEALRAAEGHLPGFAELADRASHARPARLGWPAPRDAADAIDEAEYDLAVLGGLVGKDDDATLGAATYLLEANVHLARALRARARRWLKRWTPADGLVDPSEVARAALARDQLDARSFSPTALQHWAACPYRFFLQAVHRFQPREEPVAVEAIDPLTRGGLFHAVQFGLLTRLRAAGRLPLRAEHVDEALALLEDVLADEEQKVAEELSPAIPRVWADGIAAIRADLREWVRRQARASDGWVPERFELAFGLKADGARDQADPASVPEPVRVLDVLQLRGSIDLVERHAGGNLRATDHKTGKVWARADVVVGGGTILQPVLYALACEQLLGAPVSEGRLYYCTTTGDFSERVVRLDAESRGAARQVIEAVGAALAEGFLPAAPDKGQCRWCDYKMVCGPHEEARVKRKPSVPRIEALARVRGLR